MPVYISLLRGINVGGQKVILMADLRKTYESIGLLNVKTVIQSGNVVFTFSGRRTHDLELNIKGAVKSRHGFDVGVIVLGLRDLESAVSANPFDRKGLNTDERIYLTIMSEVPSKGSIAKFHEIEPDGDVIKVIGRTAYVLCRNGYTKSPFSNNAIEKVLQVTATTRNLETMEKLVEIGRSLNSN